MAGATFPTAAAPGFGAAAAGAFPASAMLWPLLLSFGPAVLSRLFGGDQNKRLRDEIARLSSPGMQRRITDEFYQSNISSPAFSQAQGAIATGANQAAGNIAASLGARGIGTTGTGAVLSGLTPSLVGSQTAQLRSDAFAQARQATEQWLRQRIAALTGTQGPSQTQQLFAGGLEAFGPFLQAYLRSRYPSGFPSGSPSGTTVTR